MATQGKIDLDVPALLNSLGRSLYRDESVALRELLQNAHDAIAFLRRALSHMSKKSFTPEVAVSLRRSEGILEVYDNGIGMSRSELESEFSRVGASPKREALQEIVDSRGGLGERIIGQYGIGFLAAFLVADKVEVYSKPENSEAHHWWCEGDASYYIEETDVDFDRGTRVVLRLKDDRQLPEEFCSIDGIKELVRRYGFILQVPVFVQNTLINRYAQHWESPSAFLQMRDSTVHDFLRERFPVEFIDVFRVNQTAEHIQHGDVSFRAAFFVGETGVEARLFKGTPVENAATGIDVYVKGMFVSRLSDFMPTWCSFVHGAIDFDNLDVSLSREQLIDGALLRQYKQTIEDKILHRLKELKGTEKIARIVDLHRNDLIHGLAVFGDRSRGPKALSLLDELVELIPFETSHGRQTIPEYLTTIEAASNKYRGCQPNTIYVVSQKTTGAGESILAEDMGWPVVFTFPMERKVLKDFAKLHPECRLKPMSPNDFFPEYRGDDDAIIEMLFVQQLGKLKMPAVDVRVRHFRASVPAMLLVEGEQGDEAESFFEALQKASRDERVQDSEMLQMMQSLADKLRSNSGKRVLYVNASNNSVSSLVQIYRQAPQDESLLLACRTVYHTALLQSAHGALAPRDAQIVIENFNDTLAMLVQLTLKKGNEGGVTATVPHEGKGTTISESHDEKSKLTPFVFCIHSFNSKTVSAAIERVKKVLASEFCIEGLSASDEVRELTVPENVRKMIRDCKFGVADITGNNPNVMIEIGMLEILGKPVVKIRDSNDTTKIPIDIGVDLYVPYTAHESSKGKVDVGAEFVDNVIKHLSRANSYSKDS